MLTRPSFINELDWKLLEEKYRSSRKLKRIIKKIENDYPVQYAIGNVEFLNSKILVDRRVLIPRFETELFVDKLEKYIEQYKLEKESMVDICTGSGCIAISLKRAFPNASIDAVDKSFLALSLAKKNAKLNDVNIKFIKKNILKVDTLNKKYTILVSNPPYVKENEEVSPNTKYEPHIALFPGKDDIIFYKKILLLSKKILYPSNIIAFEIGATQASAICKYAKSIYPDAKIEVVNDYQNFNRFIFIFNNVE